LRAWEWGVGKTFLWQKILGELEATNAVALKNYSYVSLFGINSLDGLKIAIFENSRSTSRGAGSIGDRVTERWRAFIGFAKQNLGLSELLPWIGDALSKAGPLYFSMVKEQVICIDDLERRSDDLEMRDVLGLASFLKEQRKCKIVFLFNNEEIGDGADELSRYFEKVFDIKVTFLPTPEESVSIALPDRNGTDSLLGDCCVSLGISNIRVIKKIERAVRDIKPLLQRYHAEVTRQAIVSLTLFGWSCYQPNLAPPLEYLRTKGRFSVVGASRGDRFARDDAQWAGILKAYGFYLMDDLDLALLEVLESGCIDRAQIENAAEALDEKMKRSDQDDVFTNAWNLFHDTFENNEEKLVEALSTAFRHAAKTISPISFDATIRLLRELGRDDIAEELIRYYVDNHGEERSLWDLENHPFRGNVQDAAVIRAFANKFASFGSTGDPVELLKTIGARRSWNPEDISVLASLPVAEYHRALKENTGGELDAIL